MDLNEKKLIEERGAALKTIDEIHEAAKAEQRSMTTDEQAKFDAAFEVAQRAKNTIEANKRKAQLDAERIEEEGKRGVTNEQKDQKEERKLAARKYLTSGNAGLTEHERSLLSPAETRAQSTTPAEGGYMIPEGFSYEIDIAMKYAAGVLEVARILPTATGNDIPWPKTNDTANKAAILTENTAASEQDLVLGSTTLKSFNYTSKLIRVSRQLFQDSGINVEALIAEMFRDRMERGLNYDFTLGSGTGAPQGVTIAADGTGVTNAAATAISFNDLVNLKYAVDKAYRPKSSFMMNDSTEKAIIKLSIGTDFDMPLWTPSVREGAPDLILGHKYTINNDMAAIGASAISVLFGDFSKYIARQVSGVSMLSLNERYAEYNQIAFVMFQRWDGRYVGSTGAQAAIKKLTHAAS